MPDQKKIYLFANWKMYLDYEESVEMAKAVVSHVSDFPKNVSLALFPGSLAIKSVFELVKKSGIAVGAQDEHWVEKGAYTGAVSAHMYKSAGCAYALIGHSERRHVFKETNQDTRKKMEAALISGMIPVLCVGETHKEREADKTDEAVEVQLRAALEGLAWKKGMPFVIAYEPVWSIGTGLACDSEVAEETQEMIYEFVRGLLPEVDPILLYGGSVNPENIADYLVEPHIDGALVGIASVKIDSWKRFASTLQNLK